MADGSVKIDVGLNIGKAEKDLAKLKDKINKTEDALNANSARKTELERKIAQVGAQADEAKKKVIELKEQLNNTRSRDEKASIRAQLADATEEQRILTRESNSLNDEYVRINNKIQQGTQNLEQMKEEAGRMAQQIARARPGEAIASSLETARRSLMRFLKYAIGIRSVYILFQRLKGAIKDAVQKYAEYDKELKYNLALMSATKKAIQVTNGAALASVYNAILPIVQKIANWMLEAANAASKFIAILSGKSSYKRAVVNAAEVAASLEDAEEDTEDTADAADDVADGFKEARKQILGFDELNILSNDNVSTGGNAVKDAKEKAKEAEKAALDGIDIIEEAIDGLNESFLDKLALSMKDVLFDWHDLNPEQIAEKFIAGLGALLGAALGIALGMGPGGVLMMTLGGLLLGLIADSLIFDHDGQLSREEILSMILLALGGLTGGILGFTIGGFKGAMIGAWLGAGLGLVISQLIFNNDGELSSNEIADMISAALTALAGGVIGFAAGGPGGALIGATVGLGLFTALKALDIYALGTDGAIIDQLVTAMTIFAGAAIGFVVGGPGGALIGALLGLGVAATIESIKFNLSDNEERAKYKSGLDWFICGVLGLPTDEEWKQWGVNVIQWIKEGFAKLPQELHDFIVQPIKNAFSGIFGDSKDAGKDVNEGFSEGVEENRGSLLGVIKVIAENVIETFKQDFNIGNSGSGKTKEVGKDVNDGLKEGLDDEQGKSGILGVVKVIAENVIDTFKECFDSHSPAEETRAIGNDVDDGLKLGIEEGTPDVVAAAEDAAKQTNEAFQDGADTTISIIERMRADVNTLFQNIVQDVAQNLQQMRDLMNFEWSIPAPKIPKIEWTYKSVSYGNGQSVSIPEFFVNWYAKGGVFDFPQLIGVGENGKEAVVPLEKNTEWMQTVADGLMERMTKSRFMNELASAFASTPLPAMAGGGIVPPNAMGASGISREDMQQAIERGVYNAIMSLGGMPKSRGGFVMNVNGREFMRATYDDRKAVDEEHGISLISY